MTRLLAVLHICSSICQRDDLQGCTCLWKAEPPDLSLDMLNSRFSFRDVNKSNWHLSEANHGRQEPIYPSINLCVYYFDGGLHPDSDELLQQGLKPVSNINVSYLSSTSWHISSCVRSVNPLYYVTFTTSTLCASFILYGGFNTSDAVNTISLLSGFLVIFTGVYLLNISRADPDGRRLMDGGSPRDGIATDIVSGIQTRRSMQSRRSMDPHRMSVGSNGYSRAGDREGLIRAYDEEENTGFGLTDLTEDSDEDAPLKSANGNANGNAVGNGSASAKRSFSEPIETPRKPSPRPRWSILKKSCWSFALLHF